MGQLAAPLQILGSVVSAGSSIMAGMEADAIGKNQKKQYYNQANTEEAIAQRQAIKDRLEGRYAESRGLAVAAASGGGGADTPGVADLIGDINAQTEMNVLTSLWEGKERGAGLRYAGDMAAWEGKQKKKAAVMSAIGTGLSAATAAAGRVEAGLGGGAGAGGGFAGASGGGEGTILKGSSSFAGKYG